MNIHFEEVDPKDLMRSQLNVLRYRQSEDARRIGTLEGAIKGAIAEIHALVEAVEHPRPSWTKKTAYEGRQVIEKLKELIGEK